MLFFTENLFWRKIIIFRMLEAMKFLMESKVLGRVHNYQQQENSNIFTTQKIITEKIKIKNL